MSKRRRFIAFTGLRSAHNTERGMTLIEVLVALGIIAAVAVVFLLGMSTSSKAVMVSQESVAADSLAKSQMESIKSQDYIKVADYNPNDPTKRYELMPISSDLVAQGYAISNIDTPGNVPGTDDDENIQIVTVEVTHNGETVFTLVGYKVNQ